MLKALRVGIIGVFGLGACGHPQTPAESASREAPPEAPAALPPTVEASQSAPRTQETPALMWNRFATAWNSQDGAALELLRARDGLLALDNPGAFVRIRLLGAIGELSVLEGEYDLARLKRVRLDALLSPGEAPKSKCEDDVPRKGTFVAAPDRLMLDERFRALGQYELASSSEIARLQGPVEAARQAARFSVYDLSANVGFLFGEEDGRMVLLAVDAVIPCSA